jgi:hypothetical protein
MTNVSIPMANVLKKSWSLGISVAINISKQLCVVSVHGPRETYFVDEPRINFNCWRRTYREYRVSCRMANQYGLFGGMRIGRGNRSTRRRPAIVSFWLLQIPHHLTWTRIRQVTSWPTSQREAEHIPQTVVERKKIWIYTSTPPYVWMA